MVNKKYTSEQFWKVYKNLPTDLQDALFSEENGDSLLDICEKNKADNNSDDIVDYVGAVLVGLLPPADFQKTLENELYITPEVAERISREINRLIFYPVKSSLEALYNPVATSQNEQSPRISTLPEIPSVGDDDYREPLE
jgi:hypothetical protein